MEQKLSSNQKILIRIAIKILACGQGMNVKMSEEEHDLFDRVYPTGTWKERSAQCLYEALCREGYFKVSHENTGPK